MKGYENGIENVRLILDSVCLYHRATQLERCNQRLTTDADLLGIRTTTQEIE